jgi:coproporphyrinogen III oxidase-like Fe-S oxidoreductase
MYTDKQFKERALADIYADIDIAAKYNANTRRVFLADGDALVLNTSMLLDILAYLKKAFPMLSRVSSYALPANLIKKSVEQLRQLQKAGLTLLYYGLESGSPTLLKLIKKGAQPAMMISGLNKAAEAGMKISATVILGLGGKKHAQEHINASCDLVNQVKLTYLSTLQLGLDPTIADNFYKHFSGQFIAQNDAGMLAEQVQLIAGLNPVNSLIFRSNHASNALPLAGNLPKDRDRLLLELGAASRGETPLRPTWIRGY